MSNFKLLAIRPLENCHHKYLKNLTPGQLYRFYNCFDFQNEREKPVRLEETVEFIKDNTTTPRALYDVVANKHILNVNISAIAGRNGAGKSSIVELLFAAIYLFSVNNDFLKPNIKSLKGDQKYLGRQRIEHLLKSSKLQERQDRIINDAKKSLSEENQTNLFEDLKSEFAKYLADEKKIDDKLNELSTDFTSKQTLIAEINRMGEELKAEIYFQFSKTYYRLIVGKTAGENRLTKLSVIENAPGEANDEIVAGSGKDIKITEETLPEHFFYTIAVNYSHYAMDANQTGDWVNALFHKNDGYTTPLVINPMRTDGDFNSNDEIDFAKYRLLSNALVEYNTLKVKPKRIFLTDNQYIHNVRFTLNKEKILEFPPVLNCDEDGIHGDPRSVDMMYDIIAQFFIEKDREAIRKKLFPLKERTVNYIVQKVDKIAKRYPGFSEGYQEGKADDNKKFLEKISKDGSHITYKLRQALNFLSRNIINKTGNLFKMTGNQLNGPQGFDKTFTLEALKKWMKNPKSEEINQLLPPPFFDIDFELANEKGSKSLFTALSSGEQQLIHTVQSVIYHLNNVQSVHLSESKRIKYEAVNIIYDEIELYFHPEYQRNFIKKLLGAMRHLHLDDTRRIKAVNIMFLTHSPFILSDIPRENIMLMEIDKSSKTSVPAIPKSETFAANINDLLADGFFLTGSLMGNYVEDKIQAIIDKIIKGGQATEADEKIIDMIGDSFLRSSLKRLLRNGYDQNPDRRLN